MSSIQNALARREAGATYTVSELAAMLRVSKIMVYRCAHKGEIPHLKFGTKFIFPKVAIDRWLANVGQPEPKSAA